MTGLVGKPNVGKSTLFAAATLADVAIANYPFCTTSTPMWAWRTSLRRRPVLVETSVNDWKLKGAWNRSARPMNGQGVSARRGRGNASVMSVGSPSTSWTSLDSYRAPMRAVAVGMHSERPSSCGCASSKCSMVQG